VLGAQQGVLGDVLLYDGWGTAFVHGHGLPVGDQKWQYPPGAVLVFAVPAVVHTLVRVPYRVGFPLFMACVDALVTAALARAGRSPGDDRPGRGARAWVLGTALLGPVTLARFDLIPAACALAALLLLAGRAGDQTPRFGRAGCATALGILAKAWPAFLLVALGRQGLVPRGRPLVRAAAGAGVAVLAVGLVLVAAGAGGDLLGFLGAQRARGLQLEAVPATPFVVIRMFGAGETARYEYGSLQFGDATARTVATACSAVEIVLVAAAAARWWLARPRRPAGERAVGTAETEASAVTGAGGLAVTVGDRLSALVLVVLVTSRVLSPQYLIWVLAVAAALAALEAAAPAGGPTGGPAAARRRADRHAALVLLVAAALVSQVIYPWRYNDVIEGRPVTSVVLIARNVLLLAACWRSLRVLAPGPRASRR
jgi:hypothetical protein